MLQKNADASCYYCYYSDYCFNDLRCFVRSALWVLVWVALVGRGVANDFPGPALPSRATSAQRLLMEQIDELIASGQHEEVVENLERLFDQADGRVVHVGNPQRSGTLVLRKYIPLRTWAKRKLAAFLMANPELNEDYQARVGEAAEAAFETLRRSKDLQQIHIAAERYYASEFGVRLSSLQADLYLELGWSLACLRAAQEISPELRLPAGEEADLLDTLPAWLAWRNNSYWRKNSQGDEELLQRTREQLDRPIAIAPNRRTRLAEAFRRVAQASGIAPQEIDRKVLQGWMRSVVSLLDEGPRKELTELFEATSQWNVPKPQVRGIPCLGVTEQRGGVMPATLEPIRKWPVWSRTVPRFTATTDSTPASKPRVGETAMGTLAYYPVVHDELLLINTLSQILAFELDKGAAWPQPGGARALFDSRTAHTALVPLNFPLTGTARATLTVSGNELFARMGNPVSGWFSPRPTNDAGSSSYLVGLDLARQGTMLPGFPIRLVPPDFEQAEFEGSPLVIGDLVVSGVTQRDEVGLTRRVAAFGREDGQLRWLSKALASGSVEGMDRANLISHQLLSYAGGCLFYRTGLGVVACLEVTSGETLWMSEYSRVDKRRQTYPSTDRFRYRDIAPCVVWKGLVYCAPPDAAELFALDATTGDLVWSSDAGQSADLNHILGVTDQYLIAGGDHLVWFDRSSGRVLARFPDSATPGGVHALAQPRGLGRGALTKSQVIWPVEGRLLVFPINVKNVSNGPSAGLAVKAKPAQTIELGSVLDEGGNVLVLQDRVIVTTPSRVLAFAGDEEAEVQENESR